MLKIDLKTVIVLGAAALAAAGLLMTPPIAQDPDYLRHADGRTLLGIPNFWNVVSNLPFLVIGIMGMLNVALNRMPGYLPELKQIYFTLFAGVFLTGSASACYHLHPAYQTLMWDRLALSVVFMAIFSSIWGEHLSISTAGKMLWPLVGLGLASVIYWYLTEMNGRGDLRFYALVQFLPMAVLPAILLFSRSRLTGVGYLWGLLLAYAFAKAAELMDGPIHGFFGGTSGHEIKHWVAAAGIFIYYLAGFRRKRLN